MKNDGERLADCFSSMSSIDFDHTGWLGVLNGWLGSDDLGLALYAAKALANLDRDAETHRYVDGVHLYHPQHRNQYVILRHPTFFNTLSFVCPCKIPFVKYLYCIQHHLIAACVFYAMFPPSPVHCGGTFESPLSLSTMGHF